MVSAGDTEISLYIRPGPISIFHLGEGVFLGSQNSKCQDLPKFQFSGGGEGYSCQDLPKFQSGVLWGGGGGNRQVKNRVFLAIWSKNSGSLACLCITDRLSHTRSMYVETNETVSSGNSKSSRRSSSVGG